MKKGLFLKGDRKTHVLPTMQHDAMGMLGNAFIERENEDNEQTE